MPDLDCPVGEDHCLDNSAEKHFDHPLSARNGHRFVLVVLILDPVALAVMHCLVAAAEAAPADAATAAAAALAAAAAVG